MFEYSIRNFFLSIIVILRFACLFFRCMGIVEVAFSLFETQLFGSNVFNLVVSSVLGSARKTYVR